MPTSVNPTTLCPPRGYANGTLFDPGGRLLFVAGQIGWDVRGRLVSESFTEQFAQALKNVVAVVREAGGDAAAIGRLTIYVTDKQVYLAQSKPVGEAYRKFMGSHYPAMSLVEVKDLLEPGAMVEIEATAVIPATVEAASESEP